MKIVHIIHSLRGGGIQNFILSLAPEQKKLGHDVSIIVIDSYDSDYCETLENKFLENNVNVFRLNKLRGNKWSLIKALFNCRNLISRIKPDVVNTHAGISHLYGAVTTFGLRTKHIITVHNAPECWSRMAKCLNHNKPIIFCSHSAYDLRKQNSKKMIAIDNGISKDIVYSNDIVDLRKEYELSENDKVIVLAGSLRPQKNYHFLKEIASKLSDNTIHFFICGGGKVSEGNIDPADFSTFPTIHFLGLRSDVSAIENGADLFLSCATFEGLPIAVLEAYFNGIPCVLSPIPQHRNISDVEYVWIPDEFTAEAFVDKIHKALKCHMNHTDIYEIRKKQIERFSIRQTAINYVEFYKQE